MKTIWSFVVGTPVPVNLTQELHKLFVAGQDPSSEVLKMKLVPGLKSTPDQFVTTAT